MEDITDIAKQPITGFIQLIGEARQHFLTDSFNCWDSSQIMLHYCLWKLQQTPGTYAMYPRIEINTKDFLWKQVVTVYNETI